MKLRVVGLSDIGRLRQQNQDYVFTSEVAVGSLPNLCIVADGMGGHKAGEYASKCAVETMVGEINLLKEPDPRKVLAKAIKRANEKVRQKATADENFKGMGTTVVATTFDGNSLLVANVGDSRMYYLGDEIKQITIDHSLVEEMIKIGGLDREKARSHPDKNIITRAIGVVDLVDADFFSIDNVRLGDMILMCSDGLSNMLEDQEIFTLAKQDIPLEEAARQLIKAANANGGRDNITVILGRFEE